MPSFTRRVPNQTARPPPGTIPSLSATTPPLHLLPTGIPSIDDLLGGGLPLSNIFLILTPDSQTSWSRLISRYWISQGLVTGQKSIVVGDEGEGRDLVGGCMWIDERLADREGGAGGEGGSESEGEGMVPEMGDRELGKTKIAWRYERMRKFQTTVNQGGSKELNLMSTIPADILGHLEKTHLQQYINLDPIEQEGSASLSSSSSSTTSKSWRIMTNALKRIKSLIESHNDTSALRITIHELGSIDWEESTSTKIYRFIHCLKYLIKSKPIGILITLPSNLARSCPDGGESMEDWSNRLSWLVDAAIELRGFGDDPTLPPLFYPLHGLLILPKFPTSHHLLPPTLKHSSLLGLSTGSNGNTSGGAGENNLGFRLKRKRFVVETVHLGIEGGTGERRTAPVEDVGRMVGGSSNTANTTLIGVEGIEKSVKGVEEVVGISSGDMGGAEKPRGPEKDIKKKVRAKVRFGGEEELGVSTPEISVDTGENKGKGDGHGHDHNHGHGQKTTRPAVRHDRPDLYEF